jgi:hypothetical protein
LAKFPFDAITNKSDWKDHFETPLECAQFFWDGGEIAMPFDKLVSWAQRSQQAYDKLWKHALDLKKPSDEMKVKLFDALVRTRPRKGKGDTEFRDKYLYYMARQLVRDYGLNLTRSPSTDVESAASVLVQLIGITAGEVRMNAILTKQRAIIENDP